MRELKPREIDLLSKMTEGKFLIPKMVCDLEDGGMGSITFDFEGKRRLKKKVVSAEYVDEDGILVLIDLSVDEQGEPFELEFWKVDFNPLIRYPTFEQLRFDCPS